MIIYWFQLIHDELEVLLLYPNAVDSLIIFYVDKYDSDH